MNLRKQLLTAISIVLLAVSSRAADWYVDAVHGSDSNSGTTPSQAWRTITCAVANVPIAGVQRVFVAPGRYDEALGEQFPIRMRSKLQLLGAGAASTEIVNTAPATHGQYELQAGVVNCRVAGEVDGANIGPGTVLAGFRITSTRDPNSFPYAPVGVWVENFAGRCVLELRDLTLDSLTWGVRIDGFAEVDMSRVQLRRNVCGMHIVDFGSCTASEIEVVGNHVGIIYDGHWGWPTSAVSISRSRIEHNASCGIRGYVMSHSFQYPGHMQLNVTDCVIAHNRGTNYLEGGVGLGADEYASGHARFERCSIFDNEQGIHLETGAILTTIDSCLLQNFGADLPTWIPTMVVQYSNISDGGFVGTNGNISAPALFVDPANGDYRLRFDSPGIDAGNPVLAAGMLDILGMPRSIDGDLDTIERSDIGAFEFAPLFRQGSGRINTLLQLECWGPVGESAILQFSRKPLVSVPLSTPFGEFDLDPLNVGPLGVSAVGQSAPVIFQQLIPDIPALIGHTFSYQARTTSPLAPNGAAYTNGVQFTVLP